MEFESGDLAICVTCGTQYDAPLISPPDSCRICDDPRQYVPAGGQNWTSLNQEQTKQENHFTQDKADPRIWFITTDPKLGIGQRAILLTTPHGNVLWDCISFLSESTIEFIRSKGGLAAIVISHPHFYTTHLEWALQFDCPVYTAAADESWINRKDAHGLRKLIEGPTETIVEGVTAIVAGGHFDGSMVLHWEGNLFIADTMMTVPSAYYHKDRLPGTTSYAFMWSYPNMIPLPPAKIHGIWKALKPFEFEATYGGFPGQDNRRPDLKAQILESMKIFAKVGGHADAAILQENV
ncbi:beta-lactamase-like protein [Clohesyomyces aquaticus]|uniref:Beta-lactamase-like protein n=1 Tax=Clohesyomyces aquaticus TaxID=1231657 RepID=A0A1Y1Z2I7_9PLEO|nr:beta-lactamase-like protein [Clohesyomyces aquaticus]